MAGPLAAGASVGVVVAGRGRRRAGLARRGLLAVVLAAAERQAHRDGRHRSLKHPHATNPRARLTELGVADASRRRNRPADRLRQRGLGPVGSRVDRQMASRPRGPMMSRRSGPDGAGSRRRRWRRERRPPGAEALPGLPGAISRALEGAATVVVARAPQLLTAVANALGAQAGQLETSFGPNNPTGKAAAERYREVQAKVKKRAEEMTTASGALKHSHDGLVAAQDRLRRASAGHHQPPRAPDRPGAPDGPGRQPQAGEVRRGARRA